MVRAGLGPAWRCLFANDFDRKKGKIYNLNWGAGTLKTGDVGELTSGDLPGQAALAWASFPCQDLSLAGAGAGLRGDRSGAFWPFWKLLQDLAAQGRAPALIALENVAGLLTSHEGRDFAAVCSALHNGGYSTGAMLIDASLFVPQSRPRLFIVCARLGTPIPETCRATGPVRPWHTQSLQTAFDRLPAHVKRNWIWWNPPPPPPRTRTFADVIEDAPRDVAWLTGEETNALIAKMSEVNQAKLSAAKREKRKIVGGLYRRTRSDETGRKVQRAEVRFDDISGCLRTPAGGSSRQVVMIVEGASVKARLISSRETARLMGLPDSYILPANYNEAYHLTGDGVVVPVVRHLAEHLFEPILAAHEKAIP